MAAVKESSMVSPFYLFYLVLASQLGIGMMNFQSKISKGAGQDAWISIVVIGVSVHFLLLMIKHVLKTASKGDLISFHTDVFGKYFGSIMNILCVLYLIFAGYMILYTYIDLLKSWAFDRIPTWELTLATCVVLYYIVSGGFRVVTGIVFWGLILPSFLGLTVFYLVPYLDVQNIMPFFNHGLKDYLISAKEGLFIFIGFECLLFYLPFVKNGESSMKWAYFGNLGATIIYLFISIITFMYFTQGKLKHTVWPTLTMIKVVSFTIVESFEFIFIFVMFILVLSSICLYLWCSTRVLQQNFNFKRTRTLILILLLYFFSNIFFDNVIYGQMLLGIFTYTCLSLFYIYIPMLFLISYIKRATRKSSS